MEVHSIQGIGNGRPLGSHAGNVAHRAEGLPQGLGSQLHCLGGQPTQTIHFAGAWAEACEASDKADDLAGENLVNLDDARAMQLHERTIPTEPHAHETGLLRGLGVERRHVETHLRP